MTQLHCYCCCCELEKQGEKPAVAEDGSCYGRIVRLYFCEVVEGVVGT